MESLKAVEMIIADLSDKHLLEAICVALLDKNDQVLGRLSAETKYEAEAQANLMIVKTIAERVVERLNDEAAELD